MPASHATRIDTLRYLEEAVREWRAKGVPKATAEGIYLRWLCEDSGICTYLTHPEIDSVYARFYR